MLEAEEQLRMLVCLLPNLQVPRSLVLLQVCTPLLLERSFS
jgi:hypothetical protein